MARRPALSKSIDRNVRRAVDALSSSGSGAPAALSGGSGAAAEKASSGEGDYVPAPGPPRNLQAVAGDRFVQLSWSGPGTPGISHYVIYRNTVDNLATAVAVGTSPGGFASDNPPRSGASTTYFYWNHAVNTKGRAGPFNAAAGTMATIADDPEYLLEVLSGQISEGQLAQALSERIDLIDDAETGLIPKVQVVEGQYTVKVDADGHVSGFGLASTPVNGVPFSEFIIRADRFAVIHPGAARLVPFIIQNGKVVMDSANIVNLTASNFVGGTVTADFVNATAQISGPQIVGGTINGVRIVSPDPGDPNPSNPSTYSEFNSGALNFYKGGIVYKYLKQVLTGTATSGNSVTLTNLDRAPQVLVSLRDLTAYLPAYAGQSQRWEVRVDDTGIENLGNGAYRFTPVARLTLGASTSTAPINASGSSSGTVTSATYTTPANSTRITVSGTINSTRGTGTAPNYYRRNCTVRLYYRIAGSGGGYTLGTTSVIDHAADLTADAYNIQSPVLGANSYEYYLTFTYADAGGTFSSGADPSYWEYATDNVSGTGATASVNNGTSSNQTDSRNIVFNAYSLPSGWSYDGNVTYSAGYSYSLSRSNPLSTHSGAVTVTGPNVYRNISETTGSASDSGTANWSAASFSTTHGFSVTANANYFGSTNSGSLTYSSPTATIRRKRWVTVPNTTTANNTWTIGQASFALSSATVIDNTGVVNWIAVA